MIEPLRLWFAGRTLREKRLLIAMAGLAALTLLWAAIILPVTDGLSSARERHGDAVVRLAETEARVAALHAIERERPASLGGPLDAAIRQRANDAGFALASVAAQGPDRVQISIASARPGALLGWIARLEASGILVDTLTTNDNGDKTIGAQMTLKARGA